MEITKMLYSINFVPFPKEIKDKIDKTDSDTEKIKRIATMTILSAQH